MSNLDVIKGAADVKLASSPESAQAIAAFLRDATPAEGYTHDHVGAYRALCQGGAPLLLAAADGALYVAPAAGEAVEAALRAERYRPAGGTLTLRLPQVMGGGPATYVLWASPRYLAVGSGAEGIWK